MRAATASYTLFALTRAYDKWKRRIAHRRLLRNYGARQNQPIILTGGDQRTSLRFLGLMGRIMREAFWEAQDKRQKFPTREDLTATWDGYQRAIRFVKTRMDRGVARIIFPRGSVEQRSFCAAVEAFATPGVNRKLRLKWVVEQPITTPVAWDRYWRFANEWLRACR